MSRDVAVIYEAGGDSMQGLVVGTFQAYLAVSPKAAMLNLVITSVATALHIFDQVKYAQHPCYLSKHALQ